LFNLNMKKDFLRRLNTAREFHRSYIPYFNIENDEDRDHNLFVGIVNIIYKHILSEESSRLVNLIWLIFVLNTEENINIVSKLDNTNYSIVEGKIMNVYMIKTKTKKELIKIVELDDNYNSWKTKVESNIGYFLDNLICCPSVYACFLLFLDDFEIKYNIKYKLIHLKIQSLYNKNKEEIIEFLKSDIKIRKSKYSDDYQNYITENNIKIIDDLLKLHFKNEESVIFCPELTLKTGDYNTRLFDNIVYMIKQNTELLNVKDAYPEIELIKFLGNIQKNITIEI